jgi:hypothetical protein
MRESKMRRRFLVLAIITAIYIIALCWSIIDYPRYIESLIAEYEQRGIPRGYIDIGPYYIGTFRGALIIVLGAILATAWIVSRMRKVLPKPMKSLLLVMALISIWINAGFYR